GSELKAAHRVSEMCDDPGRRPMAAGESEVVPRYVERPPRFVAVDRASSVERPIAAEKRHLRRHPGGACSIEQDSKTRLLDLEPEVEVLVPEEVAIVGEHP